MRDDNDSSTASSPATPPNRADSTRHFTSELSPPDSQQLHAQNPANAPSPFTPLAGAGNSKAGAAGANTSKKMPPSANLNANGKRNWENNNNGAKGDASTAQGAGGGVEKESGYRWEKEEDAPGFAWNNHKAREEAQRAWTGVVAQERQIGNRYGDVLLK